MAHKDALRPGPDDGFRPDHHGECDIGLTLSRRYVDFQGRCDTSSYEHTMANINTNSYTSTDANSYSKMGDTYTVDGTMARADTLVDGASITPPAGAFVSVNPLSRYASPTQRICW